MYNQHAIQEQKITICDPGLTDNLVHRLPHIVIKLGVHVQGLCKDNGRLLAHDFNQCTYFFGTWFSTTYSKGHPPQIMTFHFIQQQRHQYVLLLTQESSLTRPSHQLACKLWYLQVTWVPKHLLVTYKRKASELRYVQHRKAVLRASEFRTWCHFHSHN